MEMRFRQTLQNYYSERVPADNSAVELADIPEAADNYSEAADNYSEAVDNCSAGNSAVEPADYYSEGS